jgi:hypothetical protein
MSTEKPNILLVLADDIGWPPEFNPQQMLERVLHAAAAQ